MAYRKGTRRPWPMPQDIGPKRRREIMIDRAAMLVRDKECQPADAIARAIQEHRIAPWASYREFCGTALEMMAAIRKTQDIRVLAPIQPPPRPRPATLPPALPPIQPPPTGSPGRASDAEIRAVVYADRFPVRRPAESKTPPGYVGRGLPTKVVSARVIKPGSEPEPILKIHNTMNFQNEIKAAELPKEVRDHLDRKHRKGERRAAARRLRELAEVVNGRRM